ncbi:MAG: nuclear transport factor 2 family protein [Gammaproteobacteria bacterium]|nr:nuclear transport factor 2 family protein [Gammaproteobacteria bacterium]
MDTQARLERIESALRALTDKDEIWRLITRYARAVDEEDDADLAAIFSDDVLFQTIPWAKEPVHGRDRTVRAFKDYQGRFGNRRRFIVNEQIDITGADTATAWSSWLVLHANDGKSFVGWGSYDWACIRTVDGWRFSKMIITVDCMTTLDKGWADAASLVGAYPQDRASGVANGPG